MMRNPDRDVTRKIEGFIPRCQPRTDLRFRSIEEALRWAINMLAKREKKRKAA